MVTDGEIPDPSEDILRQLKYVVASCWACRLSSFEAAPFPLPPDPGSALTRQAQLPMCRSAYDELGLEVHGLLVGRNVTEPMKKLCTHLHVFKSWSAVEM